jgi:hypothetical protein
VRVLRLLSRVLLLILVAKSAVVPPTRRMGRIDEPHPARVLHRYCASPAASTLTTSVAKVGGCDPDTLASGPGLAQPPSPGPWPPGSWRRACLPPLDFLTRPPSRLIC